MRSSNFIVCGAAAATLVGLVAAPLSSQDFKMTRESTVEMGGTFGVLAKMFGGMGKPVEEVFSVSAAGDAARWDRGDQSTVMHYDKLEIDQINHKKKEYYSYKLADMMAAAQADIAAAQHQKPDATLPDTAPDVQYKITVAVKQTGETKQLAGLTAKRTLLTVMAVPIKAKNNIKLEDLGSFALLSELWTSDQFPGNEAVGRLGKGSAEAAKLAAQMQSAGEGMLQAMAQNPALKVSFEGGHTEMEKLGQLPLEQTTVFVDLPPGVKLDAEAALSGSIAPSINIGAIAASEAKQSVTKKLGGLFGRKSAPTPEPKPSAPATVQSVFLRTHQVAKEFGTASLGAEWFGPPAGYKVKSPPWEKND
jgi:phosphoribosylcarboxyaminoimidazole (NCAIR) mutase